MRVYGDAADRWLPDAIRQELRRCLPGGAVDEEYREVLRLAVAKAPDPRRNVEAAIRRLDDQLERARRLYEFGEYDWETFIAKRAEVQAEQLRLREQAAARPDTGDTEWCRAQVLDLLAASDAADEGQRTLLLGSIFNQGGLQWVRMLGRSDTMRTGSPWSWVPRWVSRRLEHRLLETVDGAALWRRIRRLPSPRGGGARAIATRTAPRGGKSTHGER